MNKRDQAIEAIPNREINAHVVADEASKQYPKTLSYLAGLGHKAAISTLEAK